MRRLPSLDRWLARRRGAVLALVLAVSAGERALYFRQIQKGPLFWQHRWNQTDMSYYDAWARQLVAGDWLSRRVDPPLHFWHQKVAVDYFHQHPEDPIGPPAGRGTVDISNVKALWNRWCGGGRFYQDPLYPYLLALVYRIAGPNVGAVFVWQLAAGVLGNILLWLIARDAFGDLVAAVTALLAVLYAPTLFYEMILLRDSLVVCAGLVLAFLAGRQLARGTPRGWLALGLACGVAVTLKSHFGLFALGAGAAACVRGRGQPRKWRPAVGFLLLGTALGLAPLMVRNAAVGLPLLVPATNGTVTFALANAADSGTTEWGVGHAAAILAATDNRAWPVVAATLRTHDSPAGWLRLLARRLAAAWYWFEAPNNENFYYYRLHAPVLRFLPLTFTVVAPLALVGLALSWPARRRGLALYLLVLISLAVVVGTFVLSRYRVALAAALLPFAALTLVCLGRWLAARRPLPAAAALAAIAVVAFFSARDLPEGSTRVRVSDVLAAYQGYYLPLAKQAEARGDLAGSAAVFRESLLHEPPEVRRLGPGRPPRGGGEMALSRMFSRLHAGYAERLRATGDGAGAAREEERSRELAVDPPPRGRADESATIAPRPRTVTPEEP